MFYEQMFCFNKIFAVKPNIRSNTGFATE